MSDPIALARANWESEGWDEAALGMVAVTSVMRAQQIFQARVDDALKPFDLTFARYELLMLLHFSSRGSMPLKKASERLQVHPTSITNAVDRLEAAEFVKRVPHPTDGRATLIEITPAGRERVDAATAELNARIFRNTGFDAEQVDRLNALLTGFRRDAGDFAE